MGAINCMYSARRAGTDRLFHRQHIPVDDHGETAGHRHQKEGSGNAGTTNALGVMGKKAGAITCIVDILKGVVAVLIGLLVLGNIGSYSARSACSWGMYGRSSISSRAAKAWRLLSALCWQ